MNENRKPPPPPRTSPEWVICPWCGHEHGDGWEWAKERTVTRCDECDRMFTVDPEYTVIYNTFVAGDEGAHYK